MSKPQRLIRKALEYLDARKIFLEHRLSFVARLVKSYFSRGRFTPWKLPHLSIETTNICDAKCIFCANVVMKRKREHLDMPIFKKVVDEFVAMGGAKIDFNAIIGEPLLDPCLLERAQYVRQFTQFKSLGFVTNLQWLHKFNMDEFFDSGITWLSISTILSGRQKYLDFFGVDRYEQTIRNMFELFKENNKRKHQMSLRLSLKPTNESVDAVINHPDFKMISSVSMYDLVKVAKNQSPFYDDWLSTVKLPAYLKKRPLYPRAFRPCALLYRSLIVFSNANIGCCSCRDFEADSELILGNVRELTLKEAWLGEKIQHIRDDWRRKNKIPLICKTCSHYVY